MASPVQEVDVPVIGAAAVAQRTLTGVLSLGSAQVLTYSTSLLANVILARLLEPRDFGIYAAVSFIILQLRAFADLGIGAKLIHNHAEPTVPQQRTIFAFNCLTCALLMCAITLSAPIIARTMQLGSGGALFVRVLSSILPLYALRSVPTALLVRRLKFGQIALAECAAAVVFQGVSVIFACLGYHYWSFGIALLVSTAVRTIILMVQSPWSFGVAWDGPYLSSCLRFGTSFQLSGLTAGARDAVITVTGGLAGPVALGMLSWAYRLASFCSQPLLSIFVTTSFPALCRVRADRHYFDRAIQKLLLYVTSGTALAVCLVAALAGDITRLIFTAKWLPAVPLLYFFIVRMLGVSITSVLDQVLLASGHPGRSLKLTVSWTVLDWVSAGVAAHFFGVQGIAASLGVTVWLLVIWYVLEARTLADLALARVMRPVAWAAFMTVAAVLFLRHFLTASLPVLAALLAAGVICYTITWYLAAGPELRRGLRTDSLRLLQLVRPA
jgi:PST family polysaccharide transporter